MTRKIESASDSRSREKIPDQLNQRTGDAIFDDKMQVFLHSVQYCGHGALFIN
jgi:hypothetical protein